MAKPSPAQIQSLYNATLSAANRFASYNFKSYFVRKAKSDFAPILASAGIELPKDLADFLKSESSTKEKKTVAEQVDLESFYTQKREELEVLRRSADVNKAFEGPKLVVEHARPITAGGGSGAEASP